LTGLKRTSPQAKKQRDGGEFFVRIRRRPPC
jgi:hypothetical protein